MSISSMRAKSIFKDYEKVKNISKWIDEIEPLVDEDVVKIAGLPVANSYTKEGRLKRIQSLESITETKLEYIKHETDYLDFNHLKGNIEEYIGMLHIPLGVAGPLVINGSKANDNYMVPLATTEGSLVASYNRGMKVCRLNGGITSLCIVDGVHRSPSFHFNSVKESISFVHWALQQKDVFDLLVEDVNDHANLIDMHPHLEGNSVILSLEFSTGEASGQNIVTICADAICQFLVNASPVNIRKWYVESNYSGDKKATSNSLSSVRGKKVISEIRLKKELVMKVLKTTPEEMVNYWKNSTMAIVQSGAIGIQGHFANGLAALYLACGQDVACAAESAVGLTRLEILSNGDLYASVTLPNIMVGTVGGGTHFPIQKECLQMMGCVGEGSSKKLAEISGALCLAGELSIAAAMCANQFTESHKKLGKK